MSAERLVKVSAVALGMCAAVWLAGCGAEDTGGANTAGEARASGASADPSAAEAEVAKVSQPIVASGSVLTQHNDPQRTGAYTVETTLTPANVNAADFGPIFRRKVNGNIVTQVLYVNQLQLSAGGTKNAAIVATNTNYIHAFDADSTNPDENSGALWPPLFLGSADTQQFDLCHQVVWDQGIASTPVIDPSSNLMYVVARVGTGASVVQRLFKIDITNGTVVAQVDVSTAGLSPAPAVQFDPSLHTSRPGLLLLNGNVYLAFASRQCDNFTDPADPNNVSKQGKFQGWVFAYGATSMTRKGAFTTASSLVGPNGDPNRAAGGIWQSGAGLSTDGTSVFAVTGNSFNAPAPSNTKLSNTVLKLAPLTLGITGQFTDPNDAPLNCGDTDLTSGGSVVLPGGTVMAGGKEGFIHILDTTPGSNKLLPEHAGFQATWDTYHLNFATDCWPGTGHPACFDAGKRETDACTIRQTDYKWSQSVGPNIHNVPAYLPTSSTTGLIYTFGEKDYLRSYRYNVTNRNIDCITGVPGMPCGAAHVSPTIRAPFGMPGGFVSVSANGIDNAIAWALVENIDAMGLTPDGFHVDPFSGQPTTQKIWSHFVAADGHSLNELYRDNFEYPFVKFVPPTIAAGKVFRPTMSYGNLKAAGVTSYLIVYGQLKTNSNYRKLLPAVTASTIMP